MGDNSLDLPRFYATINACTIGKKQTHVNANGERPRSIVPSDKCLCAAYQEGLSLFSYA